MNKVYLLYHFREEENEESWKLLGVFSIKEKSESAIEKYKNIKGFCDYPDNFLIDEYSVDELQWKEGFGIQ